MKITKVRLAIIGAVALAAVYMVYAAPSTATTPRLETVVLGQTKLLAGARAAVRVVATNHQTDRPISGASVKFLLGPKADKSAVAKPPSQVFSGRTRRDGSLNASFLTPDVDEANYELTVVVQALGETDKVTRDVRIVRDQQVLLTTDKPLYQPGQMMHIRALALSKPNLDAVANKPMTLEVEDGKGNKVFKKTSDTNEFGISSADLQLASEVNMGRYTIRAIVGKSRTEKKVTVDRYVLPKFKVKFTPDKSYYLAGETVTGKVQADYFFGKPVEGKVVIKAATFDFQFKDFAEINGQTDSSGSFKFEQKLPDYFVGQPLEQGNAFVKFEVSVKDGADHTEKITQNVPVAAQPIKIIAVPDGGRIVPNVENTIYIMTTYPDGAPAQTKITYNIDGVQSLVPMTADTNAAGIAEFKWSPKDAHLGFNVSAVDKQKHEATKRFDLYGNNEEDAVVLALDKVLGNVGDRIDVTVLSPTPRGTIYLDVIREKQTIYTTAMDLSKGRAETAIRLTENMAGSLEIHAYRISHSGNIVRDTRLAYVTPANDLNVKISPDKDSYLPGKPAKVNFLVKDSQGRGIAAALGVSVVDESVFALQEMQPGMERIYFLLEKELMEPKFEVHSLDPTDILRPVPIERTEDAQRKQEAAKVLFALAMQDRQQSGAQPFTLSANTYPEKFNKMMEENGKQAKEDFAKVAKAIAKFYERNKDANLVKEGGIQHLATLGFLNQKDMIDQWGRKYDFLPSRDGFRDFFGMKSPGPDGRKDTEDDVIILGSPTQENSAQQVRWFKGMDDNINRWRWWASSRFRGGRAELGAVWAEDAIMPLPAMAPAGMAGPAAPGMPGAMMFDKDAKVGDVAFMTKNDLASTAGGAPKEQVRVRQYFPETMFWNPSVITDGSGKGSIGFDVADSITTWRISTTASSKTGDLGSATEGMKVFQDFFIDIDLPVSLTQNDEVSIPIAVYNYLPGSQTVTLEMTEEPWFELMDSATKKLDIGSGDVKAVYYRIKVKQIGNHKLTVHATGSKMSDAIMRSIEVMPDGKLFETSISDRLDKSVEKTIDIPKEAIDGASNILVKVYPGIFSQLVEGMDGIFQMPFGCFEQTTSTTYPNVLALDYMKATNQISPEVRMKAEQYINLGYQRLVTFEVKGGGFSWFGDDPANKMLTSYGVMEFADMSKVWEVDPNLITRTQDWLLSVREKDGSWTPDKNYLHEESWGKIQHNAILPTSWITWCLAKSGRDAGDLKPSLGYIKENAANAKDAYSLALVCNALVAGDKDAPITGDSLQRLVDMKVEEGDKVYWKSDLPTMTFAEGPCANVETTALATLALIDSGKYPEVITKALNFIVSAKSPNGTWGTTQATVMSLKALLGSMANRTQEITADVKVLVNGKEGGSFKITPQDSDVMRQIDCKQFVTEGANSIKIEFDGKGSAMYSVVGKYYMPWERERPGGKKLISIDVSYDRTELAKDDILKSTVKIEYNRPGGANMVMVDLGTPPGFQVLTEDIEAMVTEKTIQRYELTGRQVILYFEKLEGEKPVTFTYRMRAKFPIKAKSPKSQVYLYYDPEVKDTATPVEVVVK